MQPQYNFDFFKSTPKKNWRKDALLTLASISLFIASFGPPVAYYMNYRQMTPSTSSEARVMSCSEDLTCFTQKIEIPQITLTSSL